MKNINRTLQERIKDNALYFRGMEMTNGILIIKVQFEEKWGVYPNQAETIKVAKSTETPNEWYYYGDFEVISFDEIFDLIEDTVIMNINAAKKIELLNQKFEELKNIFATEKLEKLETLYFGFNETTVKKPKKKYNRKKKIEEPVITEEIIEMKSEMIDENNYENIEVTQ